MKCIDAEKNLDAFFDGEIASSKEIETHLENCVSCRIMFENLGAISGAMKQTFAVSAPPHLGEKLLSAFQNRHEKERRKNIAPEPQTEKIGWFGIPRFAFAAAFVLFTLATISAFQIGRMSVGEKIVMMPPVTENNTLTATKSAQLTPLKDENPVQIKYVEVPVIREKIVEVPVVKEKIVTRIIYKNITVEDAKKNDVKNGFPPFGKENLAVISRLRDNRYSTQINLKGFQIVSDLKPQVIKGEQNEK